MDFRRCVACTLLLLGGSTLALAVSPPLVFVSTPIVTISSVPTAYVNISSSAVVPSTWTWRSVPNGAFQVGENLVFSIRWGLISAGYSNIGVNGIEEVITRPAYHIVSEAHSTGLVNTFYATHDRNECWIDMQSLDTLRYEKHIHEGKYRVEEAIDFDQEHHRFYDYSQRLDKGTSEYAEGPVPPNVMDVLGSLYYVRTQPLEVGQTFVIDVYDGKKIWPLVIKVEKREKVKVPAGRFECYRVEPQLREPGIFVQKGKKLLVWMTTDESHMPVLMRSEIFIGHVTAELVSYHGSKAQPLPH